MLRILPADYRAAWQEDMVNSFLDSMHTDDPEQAEYLADYGRPSWSEASSVIALAVRLLFVAASSCCKNASPPRYKPTKRWQWIWGTRTTTSTGAMCWGWSRRPTCRSAAGVARRWGRARADLCAGDGRRRRKKSATKTTNSAGIASTDADPEGR